MSETPPPSTLEELVRSDRIGLGRVQTADQEKVKRALEHYFSAQTAAFFAWMQKARIDLVPYEGPRTTKQALHYVLQETNGVSVQLNGIFANGQDHWRVEPLPLELVESLSI